MANIIIKKYEHVNSSLGNWDTPKGKYIKSRQHYNDVLRRQGFLPYDKACQLAEKKQSEVKWIPSKDCVDMIKAAKELGNKDGSITLGQHPKLVDAMKSKGMRFEQHPQLKEVSTL